jgi:protein SCO1/2
MMGAAAIAAAPAPERTLLADPPRAIADFQLKDQTGKTVKLADLRGAPVLIFFGFTHCSSACPIVLPQLRELERQRAAFASRVEARADRAAAAFEERRAKEDTP